MENNINNDNLEKALNSSSGNQSKMSKEEEIGYHKGALSTLTNERNELVKMVQVVEQIMQAHIQRLQELGVNIQSKEK